MSIAKKLPVWAQPAQIADLVRLAVPVALSRMSMPIMSVTDTVVLGRMDQLEVPYISIAWLLLSVVFAVGMGMLQGVQVLTAELNASGEYEETGRVFRRGVWVSVLLGGGGFLFVTFGAHRIYTLMQLQTEIVVGAATAAKILAYGMISHLLVFACSCYLEALRRPVVATIITYVGVLANLVLDLALVAGWWGFEEMGADGVAWATTGSRTVTVLLLIGLIAFTTPGFKKSSAAPKNEFMRQNTVGMGGAIANVAEFTAFNLTFVIATLSSALMGTVYSLAIQPVFFCFMLFVGIATATTVRVAEFYGKKDKEGVRNASRLGVVAGCVVGLTVVLFIFLLRHPIASGMASSDEAISIEVVRLLAPLLGIASLMILFDGLQIIASMALRAQEVVWSPAALHLVSYLLVMLPAAYWFTLVLDMGAEGTMWGVVLGSLFAGLGQVTLLEWKTARR